MYSEALDGWLFFDESEHGSEIYWIKPAALMPYVLRGFKTSTIHDYH